MTQTPAPLSLSASRLVRQLNQLTGIEVDMSGIQFAERLGRLINLPDSIALSSAHTSASFEPEDARPDALQQEFMRVHAAIVQSILKSFSSEPGYSRVRLPAPAEEIPTDAASACEPYLKFYRSHTRDIDARVQNLQLQVRDSAASLSPALAQLVALDTVLGDTLTPHVRKCLARSTQLLQHYFTAQYAQLQPEDLYRAERSDRWHAMLAKFYPVLQNLLLAEVETRISPVMGLLEAINEHSEQNSL